MVRVVQKYGGAALSCLDKVRLVARAIRQEYEMGHEVVVIVSALKGVTDDLIKKAESICDDPDRGLLDRLLAMGEQESSILLGLALEGLGIPVVVFSGAEAGIGTTSNPGKAKIVRIDSRLLEESLMDNKVVVVAGYQGVDSEGNVTTLGRGGSDLSAIGLAVSLNADRCDIFTDVDGVYNADPKIVPGAKKISKISFDQMLELATSGAKVMQVRSVECAKKYNMPFSVSSACGEGRGTYVCEGNYDFESFEIVGVTVDKKKVWVQIENVPEQIEFTVLCRRLALLGVGMEMLVYGGSKIAFAVGEEDFPLVEELVGRLNSEQVGCVSVVGSGFSSYPEVMARVVEVLSRQGIEIINVSVSELRITCVVSRDHAELAVKLLHAALELDVHNSEESLLLNDVANF